MLETKSTKAKEVFLFFQLKNHIFHQSKIATFSIHVFILLKGEIIIKIWKKDQE